MRFLTLLVVFCAAVQSNALTIRIVDDKNKVVFEENVRADIPNNVGRVTIDTLEQFEIVYKGSEGGIASIQNLEQNVDVISDTEMKAYGWCFSLNGKIPETMPDRTIVDSHNDEIEWFYAYAHYLDGEWVGQCVRN